MNLKASWKKIIQAKYKGNHLDNIPTESKYSSSNTPWRSIVKGVPLFENNYFWALNKVSLSLFGMVFSAITDPCPLISQDYSPSHKLKTPLSKSSRTIMIVIRI